MRHELSEKEKQARSKVCLPLDGLNLEQANELIKELSGYVGWFKYNDQFISAGPLALDFAFDAAIKEGAIKSVTEEEAAALNVDYEKKMLEIKEKDAENKRIADLIDAAEKQTATLIEIEDMVQLSINDMMGFIVDLETNFSKEIQENNPIFTDLTQQIAKIKSKYSSINN